MDNGKRGGWIAAAMAATTVLLVAGGCAVAQTVPQSRKPGPVEREARAEIVSVNDTTLDLSTGKVRSTSVRTPHVPVGPVAVALPVRIGGEAKRMVPAEEITVRLSDTGKMFTIVQERSEPPLAPGERVRVLYEKPNEITGEARTRIEREQ